MYAALDMKQPWAPMSLLAAQSSRIQEQTPDCGASTISNGESTEAGSSHILQLLEWVNANVCQPRPFRSRQLYVWGPPAVGKTTFLRLLEKSLRVYYMPTDENFYDFYDDEDYDLIVVDEFKGQKTIQDLNRWLDGQTLTVRKKGTQCMKFRNLPVIIVSNFPPHVVYRNKFEKGELEPFTSRLLVVEIPTMIPFDRIVSAPPPPSTSTTEDKAAEEEGDQMEDVDSSMGSVMVDLANALMELRG